MPTHDLLITNATLLANPADGRVQEAAYLAVRDGAIAGIGAMADLPVPAPALAERIIDAAGNLVMPGLINCHCHGAMTLFRGLADDLPLMTWLTEHIFPSEARLVDAEMVYWCSKLAAAEMILGGTTTVADAYFHEDAAARAFCEAGMRAVAAQGIIDFPAPGVPDPKENITQAAKFLSAWQGKNSLLTPALFCHSPYTCGADTLQRAKELTREAGSLFFIHLAETRGEVAQIKEQHGCTPVALLHNLGLLDEKTVCVHSVWLEEGDIGLLRESGAKVVTCPESNMKLASGIAPLAELMEAGVPVGLGTDGCASNNDLDLFQEMGCCARLHKVAALEPTRMPAAELLGMATGRGAGVLGMAGQTGRLAIGMRADCIIIDHNQPRLTPFHNPATLVYAGRGSDVSTVIIDGRVIMEERRLLSFDLEEALGEVRRLARRVKSRGVKG
ncbi:MAG: amidohydrolase [Desulfobulbia bacterium]|nr:MAG: amidohydrolase [Deltaproteobacteria bacterium HGW-Deltaproteobacteria-16]